MNGKKIMNHRKTAILPTILFLVSVISGATVPGDAVWAVKMENASENGHELQVWIELRNGIPYDGYATTLSTSEMVSPVDVTGLSYEDNTLAGILKLTYIRDMSYRRVRTYDGAYTIDFTAREETVDGSYTGTFDGKATSGAVRGRIEERCSVSSSFHCDLWLDAPFLYDGHRQIRPMFQLIVEEREIRHYSFQEAELYQSTGDVDVMFRITSGGLGTVRGEKYPVTDVAYSSTDTTVNITFSSKATHEETSRSYRYEIHGEVVGNSIIGETRVESEGEEWHGRAFGKFTVPNPAPDITDAMYTLSFADVFNPHSKTTKHVTVCADRTSTGFVSGVALAPSVNRMIHDADVSGLSVRDSVLQGSVSLTLRDDPGTQADKNQRCALSVNGTIQKLGFIIGTYSGTVDGKSTEGTIWGQILPRTGNTYAERILQARELLSGTPEIDTEQAQRAVQEYSQPIRPGEPGVRPFWTGSTTQFMFAGRGTQSDSVRIPYETTAPHAFMYAPTLEFTPTLEATRYQYKLTPAGGSPITFSDQKPYVSLSEYWNNVTPQPNVHRLEVTPYNGDGSPIEDGIQSREFFRKSPFEGPYLPNIADYKERLLHYLRWLKNQAQWSNWHSEFASINIDYSSWTGSNRDRSAQACPAVVFSMLRLADLSDDPDEAHFALQIAEMAGYTLLRTSQNALDFGGTILDRWTFNQFHAGLAYLELYEATENPIWRNKALGLARGMRQVQRPNGTWSCTHLEGEMSDGTHSHGGEQVDEFDPSAVLYFLGKLRRQLNTSEFMSVEQKAWEWLENNTLRNFWWRYQTGHGFGTAESMRSPKEATFLGLYLLDYAPSEHRDVSLVEEIARYCEDQYTNWDRTPYRFASPHVIRAIEKESYHAPRASRTASVAHLFMRLHQETGNELHLRKAEELFKAVLMLQNPLNGGLDSDYDCARHENGKSGTPDPRHRPDYLINYGFPAVYLYDFVLYDGVSSVSPAKATNISEGPLSGLSVRGGPRLQVVLQSHSREPVRLNVYDLRGRRVHRLNIRAEESRKVRKIVLEPTVSGTYLVQALSSGHSKVLRTRIIR